MCILIDSFPSYTAVKSTNTPIRPQQIKRNVQTVKKQCLRQDANIARGCDIYYVADSE